MSFIDCVPLEPNLSSPHRELNQRSACHRVQQVEGHDTFASSGNEREVPLKVRSDSQAPPSFPHCGASAPELSEQAVIKGSIRAATQDGSPGLCDDHVSTYMSGCSAKPGAANTKPIKKTGGANPSKQHVRALQDSKNSPGKSSIFHLLQKNGEKVLLGHNVPILVDDDFDDIAVLQGPCVADTQRDSVTSLQSKDVFFKWMDNFVNMEPSSAIEATTIIHAQPDIYVAPVHIALRILSRAIPTTVTPSRHL